MLYQGMIDAKVFTPLEAETTLELLHDFGDDDLARPVTYQMLINLLGSDKRFIRGLAYWHLSRLVPEGEKFGYDPFGPQGGAGRRREEVEGVHPRRQAAPAAEGGRQMTPRAPPAFWSIHRWHLSVASALAFFRRRVHRRRPRSANRRPATPHAAGRVYVPQPPAETSANGGVALPPAAMAAPPPHDLPARRLQPLRLPGLSGAGRRRPERRRQRHQRPGPVSELEPAGPHHADAGGHVAASTTATPCIDAAALRAVVAADHPGTAAKGAVAEAAKPPETTRPTRRSGRATRSTPCSRPSRARSGRACGPTRCCSTRTCSSTSTSPRARRPAPAPECSRTSPTSTGPSPCRTPRSRTAQAKVNDAGDQGGGRGQIGRPRDRGHVQATEQRGVRAGRRGGEQPDP